MCLDLESLELSIEQLEMARAQVRERAYEKWQEAGCPPDDGLEYWLEAEREWISRNYVPWRAFEISSRSDGAPS